MADVLKANPFYKQAVPEPGVAEAGAFAPWTLPASGLLVVGILLARYQLLWVSILLAALLALPLVFANGRKRYRWLLALLLFIPLGYARFSYWDAAPNPLAALYGQTLTVSGVSNGQTLRLDDGAEVMLSPRGVVAAGRVTLRGDFFQSAGKRNPGGFDYAGYLRRRGIWGQFYVDEVVKLEPVRLGLKERLRRGVVAGLGEQQAALMQAMTLGIRDDLGEMRAIFAASGLAHILALSGLHVGILIAALEFVLRPLGRRRYPVLIAIIIGFVFLVGLSPSVVRAGLMAVAVLASLWAGAGRVDTWGALALSALLSLLYNPSWLFDISFQLSYLAVAGILLFTAPSLRLFLGDSYDSRPWWHPVNLLLGSMLVSISAQLLTLPLVLSAFGSLPLLSALVNVVAIPLASCMVPLGFVAGLAGLLFGTGVASFVNLATAALAGALIWLAQLAATWPHLTWGEVSWLGYVLFYTAIAALALAVWRRLKLWRALLVVLTASLCSMVALPEHPPPELIVFDVGQGDSALIRLPNRQEILVDSGGTPFSDFDVGTRTVLPALKALGIDELELVIASHTDADHIEGLLTLLDEIPVNQLVIGTPKPGDGLFDALMAAAERNQVPVLEVKRGQILTLGEARLDMLNPPISAYDKDNDNSVTFVLNYRNVPKALFMGDLSIDAEAGMAFPRVDIVMAGHHGSKTSTSEALLRATQPKQVVFSYGRNNYGHPADGVMERVRATGAQIHQTYLEGAVRLRLD